MIRDEKKQAELRNILYWIMDNCDDADAMDKISFAAYPHSSKYKNRHDYVQQTDIDDDAEPVVVT